jgi:hypothetical protein
LERTGIRDAEVAIPVTVDDLADGSTFPQTPPLSGEVDWQRRDKTGILLDESFSDTRLTVAVGAGLGQVVTVLVLVSKGASLLTSTGAAGDSLRRTLLANQGRALASREAFLVSTPLERDDDIEANPFAIVNVCSVNV